MGDYRGAPRFRVRNSCDHRAVPRGQSRDPGAASREYLEPPSAPGAGPGYQALLHAAAHLECRMMCGVRRHGLCGRARCACHRSAGGYRTAAPRRFVRPDVFAPSVAPRLRSAPRPRLAEARDALQTKEPRHLGALFGLRASGVVGQYHLETFSAPALRRLRATGRAACAFAALRFLIERVRANCRPVALPALWDLHVPGSAGVR